MGTQGKYPPPEGGKGPGRSRAPAGVRLAEVDEIEVEIEKLVAGGDGLGRFEGIPVFVPRSVPGDRVRARLVERRPGYGRAEITEVLSPGAGRRTPPCPHFGRCGGCDLQQIEDDLQTPLKAEAVRETLARLGGLGTDLEMEVVSGDSWAYRLRTQLHISPPGATPAIGYFARGSHELVDVDSCPVLVPELEKLLTTVRSEPRANLPRRLDLAAGDGGELSTSPPVEGLPHGEVEVAIGDLSYRFDSRCFFQGHRELLLELVSRVVGEWEGEDAYDLYAGVGLFSLPLARRYRRVVAVDGDRLAARYARINGRRGRLGNLEVETRAVESWLLELPRSADRVVLDPPRTGLSEQSREILTQCRPGRITYVSCHPAALARDLKDLGKIYRIESLALLDLFPQTGHIEVVAQLTL